MVARAPLVVFTVTMLAIVGCSGDSDDAAPTTTSAPSSTPAPTSSTAATSTTTVPTTTRPTTTSSTLPTTSVTEPPATDTAAVLPVLERVIDAYDDAVSAILADPRVAGDSSSPQVAAYLALFPDESTFAAGTLEFWASEAAADRYYRPGPLGQMYESNVQSITAASADEVTFTVCTRKSVVVVDGSGAVVSAEGGVQAGSIVAVRIDGAWRLRDLTRTPPDLCPDPREGS